MSSIYNNNYFLSNKIKVFPCAYRNSTYDATARLNTEYNFTHLPHMVDKASYIIKFNDIPENETTTKLICVIQGYYFEIELGDDDYATLQNKYLNICLASPNGAGSIESPHLCSWESSNIEDTLDGKPGGSTDYCFVGLKISAPTEENPNGKLSRSGYQCYALKLDASAKLPIMANKIENSAGTGKQISQEFTTETLSATTSISTPSLNVANGQLIANSDGIIASTSVTINNTLEVKDSTATTSVLKAENNQVVINKPTNITGTTTIKGAIQIENSSDTATDGNLKVAGTGTFNSKLTVTADGADISGTTILRDTVDITGKTTIGPDGSATEIENNKIKTSEIATDKITVANSMLAVDSSSITAKVPVTINNTLEVKDSTNTSSILKVEVENNQVVINKPTNITGATEIKGDSGNLKVAGTGEFGGKLTVTAGGADITGDTQIKKSSSGATDGNLKVAGTGEFGGKLTVNGAPMESNDAVRKHELDNTFWLSGGEAIVATEGARADLNDDKYKKFGNYYLSGADSAQYVDNFPSFMAKEAFILTVYAGNGLGYPCQRLRTLNHRAVAERWFNSDSAANRWEDWQAVDEYSYRVRSTQALDRSGEESVWSPYAAEATALCHLPYLTAGDFPETSNGTNENNTKLFFFCLLSLLFDKGFVNNSYVGISSPNSTPNSTGNTLVHIYPNLSQQISLTINNITYTKPLPTYSTGVWTQLDGTVIVFGTYENEFYCHEIDSRFAEAPTGFTSRFTGELADWPIVHKDLKESSIRVTDWRWTANNGSNADVAFVSTTAGDSPQMNIVLDGSVYVNEGINKVVTSNESGADVAFYGTGSTTQPVYLDANNKIQPCSEKVGDTNKPIWMDKGELKPCSGQVGDTNKPIYMGGDGTLTACKYAYTVTDTLPSELQADTIYFITED